MNNFFATALALCVPAHAPSRAPTTLELTNPATAHDFADGDRFTITWRDDDRDVASAAATIELYFAPQNPRTFARGTSPPQVDGTLIANGIRVHDTKNAFEWETTAIPTGAYWIFARVDDPEVDRSLERTLAFSPGVVIVAHKDDPLPLAIVFVAPKDPYVWPASDSLELEFSIFDPDESGEVMIEAMPSFDLQRPPVVIAQQLHAESFIWDTRAFPEGEQTLRATLRDRRGRTFVAYDRHFRFVNHIEEENVGCQCVNKRALPVVADFLILLLLVVIVVLLRTRR